MSIGFNRRRNRSSNGQRIIASAVVDVLESRRMLSASVTVHVYNDPNQNGSWSSGNGIAGRQVFVDLNGDNVLESGEPTTLTDSTGTATLSLAGVSGSTVNIGEALPDGIGQTVPGSYEQSVSVSSPATVSFGNLTLTAVPKTDASGSNPANYDQYGFGNIGSNVVKQAVTQPDGKLVVAATDGSSTVVARYFADGEADKNFSGPDGVINGIGSFSGSTPAGLVVEPDGHIVVALNHNDGTVKMTRITASGSEDFGFNQYSPPNPAVARGLALMVDGSLLLTTYITQSGLPDKVEVFNLSPTTGLINTGFAADGGFGFCAYTPPANGYSQNAADTVVTTVTASGGFAMVMSDFGSGDSTDLGDVYYSYHAANGNHVSTANSIKIDAAIDSEFGPPSDPNSPFLPQFQVQAITPLSNGGMIIAGSALSGSTPGAGDESLGIPTDDSLMTYAVVIAKISQAGVLDTTFGDLVHGSGAHTGVTYNDDAAANSIAYGAFEAVSDVVVLPNGTGDGNILLTSHVNEIPFDENSSTLTDPPIAFEYCRVFNSTGGSLTAYNSSSSATTGFGSILQIQDSYLNTTAVCPLASISGVLPTITASTSDIISGSFRPAFVNGSVGFTGAAPPVMLTGNAAADIVLATTAPTASLSGSPSTITTSGSTAPEVVKIKFSDAIALKIKTISTGNLKVHLLPNGPTIIPTFLGVEAGGNSQNAVADYSIAPVGGSWLSAANGTYQVDLLANQVKNAQKFAAAHMNISSFAVNVPATAIDTTPPTATMSVIPSVTTADSSPLIVSVTYTDNVAVKLLSIDSSDITVAGPGGTPLTVSAASTGSVADAASITVSYTVDAPAGGWVAADNGTYPISLVAGAITDTAASPNATAAKALGSFTVAVGIPSGLLAPVPDVTSATAGSVSLSVTYSDSTAPISPASISTTNLTVTDSGGNPLMVTAATAGVAVGNQLAVTYTVAAPSGGFQLVNNGTYTIDLVAGQVTDTSANAALAATLGSFTVNVSSNSVVPPPGTGLTSSSVALTVPVTAIQTGNLILFSTAVAGSDGGIPTGTVTFLSGTTALGTVTLNAGAASFSLATVPAGDNSITVSYSGDSSYATSTSAAQTVTVTAAPAGSSALTPALTKVKLPAALVIAGAKHALSVPIQISNTGGQLASGFATVNIYASLDGSLDAGDTLVATVRHNFKIKAGKNSSLTIRLNGMPASLGNGSYHLLAQLLDASGFAQTAATSTTVTVAAPVIVPTLTFAKVTLASAILSGNKVRGSVTLNLANTGNVAIQGATTILLHLLTEGSTGTVIKTLVKRLNIPAGKSGKITVTPGSIPLLATGVYHLVALVQIPAANGAAATTTIATDPVTIQVTASVG